MANENNSEVRAVARYIGIAPQKVRRVVNVVRGMKVDEALAQLKFMTQGAAEPVSKVVASAAANAEENLGWNKADLYVAVIKVDEAPTRKSRRFGARGRFKPILKRNSHITVILKEREA